jgi:ankyrin repeat protein
VIRAGDAARLDAMLTATSSVATARGPDGDTPLHVAAEHDRAAIVKRLLAAGADAEAVYGGSRTRRCRGR